MSADRTVGTPRGTRCTSAAPKVPPRAQGAPSLWERRLEQADTQRRLSEQTDQSGQSQRARVSLSNETGSSFRSSVFLVLFWGVCGLMKDCFCTRQQHEMTRSDCFFLGLHKTSPRADS